MANKILTDQGWEQRIRDKLGIDDAYVPDTVVQQPDVISIAESNIIMQTPDYTAVSTDGRIYLEAATVLECCILLCPGMASRLPTKQAGAHESHELSINWDKKREQFITERDGLVGKLLELDFPSHSYGSLKLFSVTFPKRRWP